MDVVSFTKMLKIELKKPFEEMFLIMILDSDVKFEMSMQQAK